MAALGRANNKCEYCGATQYLNVHHIISKRHKPLKFNKFNSIVLCARHHKFDNLLAAHNNPFAVLLWLEEVRPQVWVYLREYTEKHLTGVGS